MSRLTKSLPVVPIPYGRQTLGTEEVDAVVKVLQSSTITQGPKIEAFEQAVADYCQVPYAVAFSSGTAALHGACHAAGLGEQDEAITSPITFVATSNAVLYQKAKPVFADIKPHTWNLDIEKVAQKLSARTKALLPVHFAGQPVDLEAFYALADQHNLTVIEDACHALGASYHGKPIGHCRDMAVFSFHPVKSITTGEGGMVVTPHRHFYEKLCQFRTHGITKVANQFEVLSGAPWEYEMQDLGYNYRMTDFQAALGVVQMTRLDEFIQARNHLTDRYRKAFADNPAIRFQQTTSNTRSADHLFPIWIDPTQATLTRRQLFETLVTQNIRPQVHYIPVHLQPYYRTQLGTKPGDFPQAEHYYNHCLSLPLYPTLTEAEQDYVIHQVKSALGS
jgi:perosamine synthetase